MVRAHRQRRHKGRREGHGDRQSRRAPLPVGGNDGRAGRAAGQILLAFERRVDQRQHPSQRMSGGQIECRDDRDRRRADAEWETLQRRYDDGPRQVGHFFARRRRRLAGRDRRRRAFVERLVKLRHAQRQTGEALIEIGDQNHFSPVDLGGVQSHGAENITGARKQPERTTERAGVAFDGRVAAVDLPLRNRRHRAARSAMRANNRRVGRQDLRNNT